jgi:hypothetical protein
MNHKLASCAAGAATTADGDMIAVSAMDVLLFGTNWTSVQSTFRVTIGDPFNTSSVYSNIL